jgi:hypothetical protein
MRISTIANSRFAIRSLLMQTLPSIVKKEKRKFSADIEFSFCLGTVNEYVYAVAA